MFLAVLLKLRFSGIPFFPFLCYFLVLGKIEFVVVHGIFLLDDPKIRVLEKNVLFTGNVEGFSVELDKLLSQNKKQEYRLPLMIIYIIYA